MTDRSKIIRHPAVTHAELAATVARLRGLSRTLLEVAEELAQVNEIIYEMFPGDMKATNDRPALTPHTPDRRTLRCPTCGQWDGHRTGCRDRSNR